MTHIPRCPRCGIPLRHGVKYHADVTAHVHIFKYDYCPKCHAQTDPIYDGELEHFGLK